MKELDYASLVKTLRHRGGLTQEEFAHEFGVTFSTVNNWENGRRRPMPFFARRLAEMAAAASIDIEEYEVPEGQPTGK